MADHTSSMERTGRGAGLVAAVLLAGALGGPVGAQAAPAGSVQASPGEALAMLEGEWQGVGWALLPDGTRMEFDVFETVLVAAGGEAVVFIGEGFGPRGAGRSGDKRHDATGLITRAAGGYEMRAVTAEGYRQDMPMRITGDGFAWSIEMGPAGRRDYTARIGDGVWQESGAYCPPEGACMEVFGMRLERAD
ncbi:hypothetical protein [Maricaulis sp. CAU 1757]